MSNLIRRKVALRRRGRAKEIRQRDIVGTGQIYYEVISRFAVFFVAELHGVERCGE